MGNSVKYCLVFVISMKRMVEEYLADAGSKQFLQTQGLFWPFQGQMGGVRHTYLGNEQQLLQSISKEDKK